MHEPAVHRFSLPMLFSEPAATALVVTQPKNLELLKAARAQRWLSAFVHVPRPDNALLRRLQSRNIPGLRIPQVGDHTGPRQESSFVALSCLDSLHAMSTRRYSNQLNKRLAPPKLALSLMSP